MFVRPYSQSFTVMQALLCGVLSIVGVRADDAAGPLFDDAVLADNVLAMHDRAAAMEPERRYRFLVDDVLPLQPAAVRLAGKFVPRRIVDSGNQDGDRSDSGGILISSLFDLLDVAAEIGRLQELQQQITAFVPKSEHDRRAKLAVLILLALEEKDDERAGMHFDAFIKLVRAKTPKSVYEQWPETLLAYRAVYRFPQWNAVAELLEHLRDQRVKNDTPANSDVLHTHLWALNALSLQQRRTTGKRIDAENFSQWISVGRTRAETRGSGFPAASWRWVDTGGVHVTGHEEDILYFVSPLRGDFEVEADINPHGRLQVLSAGQLFSKAWDADAVWEGNLRFGLKWRVIDRPLAKLDRWLHYRAVYRGNECLLYLNGRLIKSIDRSATDDPWVALRSWSRSEGTFREIRITGDPLVPDEVGLLNPDLTSWKDVFDKPAIRGLRSWAYDLDDDGGGQLVSPRYPVLLGTHAERLIQSIRPMTSTGSVAYEFFYTPGSVIVHPAIDFIAFVLNPAPPGDQSADATERLSASRVLIHRVTDGAYDQSEDPPQGMGPAENFNAGDNADRLPLLSNAWNQMKVMLNDDVVRLELNGEIICRHRLETNDGRRLGFFHYADRSEARVRNVVLRGNWLKSLPPLSQQEFADPEVGKIEETRPNDRFEIDFATAGVDERYVTAIPGESSTIIAEPGRGIVQTVDSAGAWTQSRLNPAFRMEGDFDGTAHFGSLVHSDHPMNGVGLVVSIADGHEIEVYRRQPASKHSRITVGWKEPVAEGKPRSSWQHISSEAVQGTFRIARRGDTITALFAENDSRQFQIVGSRTIAGSSKHSAEVRLQTIANNGGNTVATWTSLTLEAQELWHLPDPQTNPPSFLFVMNADGSNLRQLTQQIPGRESQGSPDWSPDGTRIAFDTWTGDSATSDMHIVNADGTRLRTIGLGSMPSFSTSGDRLCCTSLRRGTIVMDSAGQNRETLTTEGWGAQWSPDGNSIAYESRHRKDGKSLRNITLLNVETKQERQLLTGDDASRYSWIYYNMEWSPDSQRICFKGVVPGGQEIAIVNVASGSVQQISTLDLVPDFSWHPDGQSILVAGSLLQMGGAENDATYSTKGNRLYVYDFKTEAFRLLPGQPMNQSSSNMAWSPDGKQLAFVSRPFPEPVRWQGMSHRPSAVSTQRSGTQ